MLGDDLGGGESGRQTQEGGDRGIHMAESHCSTAETNTTLQSNFNPVKLNSTVLGLCCYM